MSTGGSFRSPRKTDTMPFGLRAAAPLPLLSLVAANLIPLAGVIGFGWDVGSVLLLYWAENVVVGLYNIPRMALASKPTSEPDKIGKLVTIPFFCGHYAFFCAVHFIFVIALGGLSEAAISLSPDGTGEWLIPLFRDRLTLPLAALVVSHGISFYQHYVRGGEYKRSLASRIMFRPYARIAVLHVAILAGGFGIGMLRSRTPMLVVLIVLKTIADAALHRRSHAQPGEGPGRQST